MVYDFKGTHKCSICDRTFNWYIQYILNDATRPKKPIHCKGCSQIIKGKKYQITLECPKGHIDVINKEV